MITTVIKKDGTLENFSREKLCRGIFKAVQAAGGSNREKSDKIGDTVIQNLNNKFSNNSTIKYSDILDEIEYVLIKNGHDKVSRAFLLYRFRGEMLRNPNEVNKDNVLIEEYISQEDWRVKDNANMSYSLQGLNFNVSSKVTANYWLTKIYPTEIAKLHVDCDLHLHDLGILGPYCVGWDLQQLLFQGFNGVSGKISSGPAKHLRTALGQAVNFIFTLQGEAAGAQAFSNFDTLLAPFIKKDNMDRAQVKQALQEFLYGMNVSTRVGFQCPFSNVTLDVMCPEKLKSKPVLIGGEIMDFNYGDCQNEMDLFNDVFCELMVKGDYQGRLFSFPIPTYNIHKNFDWNNPRFNGIWEMTAKYGIPYFANYVNSDMDADQATSMCCRLRINRAQLEHRGGGLFGSSPNTGSIGVVTINMPRIGYTSKTEEEFFQKLNVLMDAARDSLIIKVKLIEKLTEQGLYPYTRVYLGGIKKDTGRYWTNHFLTIGLLGMNEALINFMKKDITTTHGNAFAEKVLQHMRDRITQYQKETGFLFNLEATPGEGTTRRFSWADKKKYPEIIVANEKKYKELHAAPYYTNSSQIPVDANVDLFTTLELQDPLQTKYTGGTVLHVYLGEKAPSPEAVKNLIRRICENYKLPYISLTPSFSICPIHHYIPGEHTLCPICAEPDDSLT